MQQAPKYSDAQYSPLSPFPPVLAARHSSELFESFTVYTDGEPFYLPQLTAQKVNQLTRTPELLTQNSALQLRTALINTLRWTYKYNTLHRRSVHNAYKLTNVKRLFSLGYFDFKITDSNVWFSDQYGRDLTATKTHKGSTSSDVLSSSLRLLYQSSLGRAKPQQFFSHLASEDSASAFRRLAFYESSFYFFLKRSYLFTTLNSHSLPLIPLKDSSGSQPAPHVVNLTNLQQTLASMPLQSLRKSYFLRVGDDSAMPYLSAENAESSSSQNDILLTRFDKNVWTITTLTLLHNFGKTMELTNQQLLVYLPILASDVESPEDPTNLLTKL